MNRAPNKAGGTDVELELRGGDFCVRVKAYQPNQYALRLGTLSNVWLVSSKLTRLSVSDSHNSLSVEYGVLDSQTLTDESTVNLAIHVEYDKNLAGG